MLIVVVDTGVFYLVTLVCLATGILTIEEPRDFQPVASLQSPPLAYLPPTNTAFPKLSQHAVFSKQALDNGLRDGGPAGRHFSERQAQAGYSYLKPLLIDLKLPSKDQPIKSITDKQRSAKAVQSPGTITTSPVKVSGSNSRARLRSEAQHHRLIPHRSSYQVVEELDEYLTDDSDHAGLPYRGKAQTTNPHRNSQDITMAIKALDHFLSGVLNDDSYNSELHPPSNPVLALVLSRYGRYVPGARNPRVYAHMAVNNIHNNKPFGSYKLESDELPTYVRR